VCDAPNINWTPQRAYEGGSLTPFEEFVQENLSRQYGSANGMGYSQAGGNYGAMRGNAFNDRISAQVQAKAAAYREAYAQGKELDYNKYGEWGWWEDGGDGLEYSINEKGELVITRRPIVTSKFHKLGSRGVSKNPYDGHSLSVSGNIALGGGVNFSLGFVWNRKGDWRFFVSGGPSEGFDASIGVAVKSITNKDSTRPFDPNQYRGWGSSHNVGVSIVDIVLLGGDNLPNEFTGAMGASYLESGGGVSFSIPIAYTYQMSKTFFPGDWFN
jgi:hypothetical protein